MGQRKWIHVFALAGTVSGLICGCGKKEASTPAGENASPNAAVQLNISGTMPVELGPENLQTEIDKAASGIHLTTLDLNSVGLPLMLDAPEGAKAERDPHSLPFGRDSVVVRVSPGDHFAIRIRRGKNPFEQKRKELASQKTLINNKDLILSSSMLLLDERCEFAQHVVIGGRDYTIENIDPLFGRQINHSQADCLLMLKCIGTLRAKTPATMP